MSVGATLSLSLARWAVRAPVHMFRAVLLLLLLRVAFVRREQVAMLCVFVLAHSALGFIGQCGCVPIAVLLAAAAAVCCCRWPYTHNTQRAHSGGSCAVRGFVNVSCVRTQRESCSGGGGGRWSATPPFCMNWCLCVCVWETRRQRQRRRRRFVLLWLCGVVSMFLSTYRGPGARDVQ